MDNPAAPEFKVVMIGDAFVGKTSLVNRFWNQHFNKDETPTIAASYIQVPLTVEQGPSGTPPTDLKLNIWDTAGTEKFQCLVPLYARTADALVIVFDISSPTTFEGAKKWYSSVLEETGGVSMAILCANKSDLAPDADVSAYKAWAESNHAAFAVTSALNGNNVVEMFDSIAQTLISKQGMIHTSGDIEKPIEKEQSGCC